MKRLKRVLLLVLVFGVLFGYGAFKGSAVSPGIEVLRADTRLVKCCVNGQKLGFTESEFVSLTGASFDFITVKSLPDIKTGVLKLAGVDVFKGQLISAGGIELLKFVPASGFTGSGGFSFTVNAKGWESEEIDCLIRYSETVNFAPIAASESFGTYRNVSVSRPLSAYDPDGDVISFVIERYPTGGTLVIDKGVATYTPSDGFVGADSFVYHTVDAYGNKSEAATADITVRNSESGIYFADMREDSAHLQAILAAEKDVMTYTLIGDSYYFTPDERVSRIDFAVMLVSAAGIKLPDKQYPTNIFTDTETQSYEKRMCLEAAVTAGLIEVTAESFYPDEDICIADAVSMTEKALDEGESIAYYENPTGYLTKKDAAIILTALLEE